MCCSLAISIHQYYCELWSFRLDLVYSSWSNFLNIRELFRAVVSVDCWDLVSVPMNNSTA